MISREGRTSNGFKILAPIELLWFQYGCSFSGLQNSSSGLPRKVLDGLAGPRSGRVQASDQGRRRRSDHARNGLSVSVGRSHRIRRSVSGPDHLRDLPGRRGPQVEVVLRQRDAVLEPRPEQLLNPSTFCLIL